MREYQGPDQHYSLSELGELMLEIACAEGLDLDTAYDRAAEQFAALHSYTYEWNTTAWLCRRDGVLHELRGLYEHH